MAASATPTPVTQAKKSALSGAYLTTSVQAKKSPSTAASPVPSVTAKRV